VLLVAVPKPLTPPESRVVYKTIQEMGEFKRSVVIHYRYKRIVLARYTVGYAAHYGPGVMERVARKRKMPIVSCMISSPTLLIGTWVYVRGQNTNTILHCRVTDVSAPKDKKRHIHAQLIAELNYGATINICGSTKLANKECPISILLARK
jgi:hypothetical protein